MNESWRIVWRDGFQPLFSTERLEELATWLRTDNPRLVQGSTTTPPPLMCVSDWPLEACDAIALAAISTFDCTVGEAEEAFAKACFEADQRLGEPAACRWFLNWFDDTPRAEMRRELLAEVEYAIAVRTDFVAFVPSPFKAAFAASPSDSTLCAAIIDWLIDHDQARLASVWKRRKQELESKS